MRARCLGVDTILGPTTRRALYVTRALVAHKGIQFFVHSQCLCVLSAPFRWLVLSVI